MKIAKYFDGIYGTPIQYDKAGLISGIGEVMTDDKFYHYNNRIYQTLNQDGIVDFCCVADYRDGSILSNILRGQNVKEELYEEENIR